MLKIIDTATDTVVYEGEVTKEAVSFIVRNMFEQRMSLGSYVHLSVWYQGEKA